MTTAELRQATMDFDEDLGADQAQPLTPSLRKRWQNAKSRPAAGGIDVNGGSVVFFSKPSTLPPNGLIPAIG